MKKGEFIWKAKYYLYKYGVNKLLPSSKLNFAGHLGEVAQWISEQKNIAFTSFPDKKFDYHRREELYQYLVDQETAGEAVDYLEFGVANGSSFKWWESHKSEANSAFYGFDTFTGLPENWGAFKKGDMSSGNKKPEIEGDRHQFYQGLFQDTLYDFLKDYEPKNRKIVHLDADLYSSTLFVLTALSPYLKKGDILLFDEFNVPLHEFKAFTEWVNSYYIDYSVVGEINNFLQVAIKLEDNAIKSK